jgi:hypothetical protein
VTTRCDTLRTHGPTGTLSQKMKKGKARARTFEMRRFRAIAFSHAPMSLGRAAPFNAMARAARSQLQNRKAS